MLSCVSSTFASSSSNSQRPNIVVFLTDDQDLLLNSVSSLPAMNEIFVENGLHFINAFSSTPVCCVSRSSIITGKYVHNHGTRNQSQDGGCYDDVWVNDYEPIAFNTYLSENGYKTLYSGKYLNEYCTSTELYNNVDTSCSHVPVGWDEWFVTARGAKFYDYTASLNGEEIEYGNDESTDYFPELQNQHAIEWLEKLKSESKKTTHDDDEDGGMIDEPFLMVLASPAAHSPFTPSAKYKHIVDDEGLRAPQFMSSWNYAGENALDTNNNMDKGPVMRNRDELDSDGIDKINFMYRMRHATLLTVDDMVNDVYNKIDELNELDNTYFFYFSDHGFHLGQYGLLFGKKLFYEPDIRIPFFINTPMTRLRESGGNDLKKTNIFASTIDVAATVVDLALGYVPDTMDGQSLIPYFEGYNPVSEEFNKEDDPSIKQAFLIEYFGESGLQSDATIDYDNIIINEIFQTEDIGGNFNDDDLSFSFSAANIDTWNNTFSCVRYDDGSNDQRNLNNIGGSFAMTGEIFCQYTCFDRDYNPTDCLESHYAEYNGEYYNFNKDSSQRRNQIHDLPSQRFDFFTNLLNLLLQCEGSECNDYRIIGDDTLDYIGSISIDKSSSSSSSSSGTAWSFYIVFSVLAVNSILIILVCCVCAWYARKQRSMPFNSSDVSESCSEQVSKEDREASEHAQSSYPAVNEHTVLLTYRFS